MSAKYCKKCGAKLIRQEIDTFNEKTGLKDYIMVCPTDICRHTGIAHEWKEKMTLWEKVNFLCICKKCGYYV